MGFPSPEEPAELAPAEEAALASPIPMQVVASDEYSPAPQSTEQKEVEALARARIAAYNQR